MSACVCGSLAGHGCGWVPLCASVGADSDAVCGSARVSAGERGSGKLMSSYVTVGVREMSGESDAEGSAGSAP